MIIETRSFFVDGFEKINHEIIIELREKFFYRRLAVKSELVKFKSKDFLVTKL